MSQSTSEETGVVFAATPRWELVTLRAWFWCFWSLVFRAANFTIWLLSPPYGSSSKYRQNIVKAFSNQPLRKSQECCPPPPPPCSDSCSPTQRVCLVAFTAWLACSHWTGWETETNRVTARKVIFFGSVWLSCYYHWDGLMVDWEY